MLDTDINKESLHKMITGTREDLILAIGILRAYDYDWQSIVNFIDEIPNMYCANWRIHLYTRNSDNPSILIKKEEYEWI